MRLGNRIRAGMTTAAGLACLLAAQTPAGADYTISGAVDTPGNAPLAGIPIQVLDANGDVVAAPTSGANGAYSVDLSNFGAGAGAYTIREAAPATTFTEVTPTFNNAAPVPQTYNNPGAVVATTPVPGTTTPTSPPQWNYNNQPNWVTGAPLLPFETPVNLTGPTTDLSKVVTINNTPAQPTTVQDTLAQFKFNYAASAGDTLTAGGATAQLQQFHFHMPAENTLNGVNPSMELHFVYVNPTTGAESVIAVFAQDAGTNAPANAGVAPIITNLQTLAALTNNFTTNNPATKALTAAPSAPIDLNALLPTNTQGYFFYGSLTTPPLSVGVNWFVFSNPISLSDAQFQALKNLESAANFYPNNRALQPSDGRQLNEIDYNINLTSSAPSFSTADFQLAPVPEPSSWVMMGLGVGLGSLALLRRGRVAC